MTTRITITNAANSHHSVLVNKPNQPPVAIRPGESLEEVVWEGMTPFTLTELTDETRKDVVWLRTRAT